MTPAYPALCYYRDCGLFWLRVFGYGLFVKDTRRRPPGFSERVLGHGWRLGRWLVGGLTP